MVTSKWFKIYTYLVGRYFKRGKMVVELLDLSSYTATYRIIRNGKIVVTRLDHFNRYFCIINHVKLNCEG